VSVVALGPTPGRRAGLHADINVTPLVDVVLVLLIIFMVVTPMLAAGHAVTLPTARADAQAAARDALVVTLARDGALFVGDERVAPGALVDVVRARRAPGAVVRLRADAALSMGALRPVLRSLKEAHLAPVALAVEPPTRAAP